MPIVDAHPELVAIALSRTGGHDFELFAQDFLAAQLGLAFQPLGGTKDGGADGVMLPDLFAAESRAGTFMQASIEEAVEGKIRHTVDRLREVGRVPTRLIYASSKTVKLLDQVEESLTGELDVVIRIYDEKYFSSHINDTPQTRAAFRTRLEHLTSYLRHVGGTSLLAPSENVKNPAAFVFLRQELERRSGNTELLDAVTDSLILWALEGTDPEAGLLRSSREIADRIATELPSAATILAGRISHRLQRLSRKVDGERSINWHKAQDSYCLPYQTRLVIEDDNAQDEALVLRVQASFRDRLDQCGVDEDLLDTGARAAMRAMQATYENQGLKLAAYLEGKTGSEEEPAIADQVFAAMHELAVAPGGQYALGDAILASLRASLYSSTEDERLYFSKLNRTYSLLFTLQSDPSVVKYFQDMAGDFYLYVGADILVRCLSERYLRTEDQMTRNLLRMLADSGAKLVLAEPVLAEVVSHLRSCDHEFRNFVSVLEPDIDYQMARNVGPIVLRAYLYSRLAGTTATKSPGSWPQFVEQICSYSNLHSRSCIEEVKRYLLGAFSMNFESASELGALADQTRVKELSESLVSAKKHPELARNDALLACAIYGRREQLGEGDQATEFGHRTWWLTKETTILRYSQQLINEHNGSRYMMRPEFALNFLSFAPSVEAVRRAYGTVFPSLLGIRLAKRMDENTFHAMIQSVKEATELEPARRAAAMSTMADQLMGDFRKTYNVDIDKS